MPHFMVCDRYHSDAPTEQLLDLGAAGVEAVGLWTLAGSLSQAQLSDGQLTLGSLARLIGSRQRAQKSARLLCKVGLWEEFIDDLGQPCYQFVDWFEFHKPGAGVKLQRARRAELKKPEVVEPVKVRDQGRCRYCCCLTRSSQSHDRRSKKAFSFDHVDPLLGPVGPTNVVVACMDCNRTKGERTPEQAGMTLHVPGCAGGSCKCVNPPPPDLPNEEDPEKTPSKPVNSSAVSSEFSAETQTDTENEADNLTLRPERKPVGDLARTSPRRNRTRTRTGKEEGLGLGDGPGQAGVAAEGRAGRPPPGAALPASAYPQPVGSPWFNHHGPPPDVDEPKCPIHGLDMPCRKCRSDRYAEEASP